MKKFTDWMEQKFVPKAAKIASQRFLVAIKDSFVAIMPITYGWFNSSAVERIF